MNNQAISYSQEMVFLLNTKTKLYGYFFGNFEESVSMAGPVNH